MNTPHQEPPDAQPGEPQPTIQHAPGDLAWARKQLRIARRNQAEAQRVSEQGDDDEEGEGEES